MYPYRSKTRWLAFGRYAHLAKAINDRRGIQDSLLENRVQALVRWNRVRFFISILLSLGIIGAGLAWAARYSSPVDEANRLVGPLAAASSTLAGALTLAYLFLSRLLGQIEADILAILTIGRKT